MCKCPFFLCLECLPIKMCLALQYSETINKVLPHHIFFSFFYEFMMMMTKRHLISLDDSPFDNLKGYMTQRKYIALSRWQYDNAWKFTMMIIVVQSNVDNEDYNENGESRAERPMIIYVQISSCYPPPHSNAEMFKHLTRIELKLKCTRYKKWKIW